MEDKILLDIALFTATAGIITLLLLSYYDKIPEKSFNDITSADISSYVKISGTVRQIYMHNNSMSIKLVQECTMDVNMFENIQDIRINDTITVQGTVQEYKGKMQVLADRIIK